MTTHTFTPRRMLEIGESIIGHTATMALGFVMMVVGLAMGVSMVLLPVGLAVGLAGVLVFLAGIFYRSRSE